MKVNSIYISCFRLLVFVAVTLGLSGAPSLGGEYPEKPITMICPYAAGGSTDIAHRVIADYLSKKWKQQISIVNKVGGNTIPATLELYNSIPDGYTLFADSIQSSSLQCATIKDLPFKLEDRSFIVQIGSYPFGIYSNPKRSWKKLNELIEFVRKQPSEFKWASIGTAGLSEWGAYQLFDLAGINHRDTKMVVFRAAPECLTSLAGGFVDVFFCGVPIANPFFQAGKIEALAVAAKTRTHLMPNVPTSKEAGLADLVVNAWLGVTGPKGLPLQVIEKWNKGIKEALSDPEFVSKFQKLGNEVTYLGPDEFRKLALTEMGTLKSVFTKYGATN